MQVVVGGIVGLVIIVAVGVVALIRPRSVPQLPTGVAVRLATARDGLNRAFGAYGACFAAICAGIGLTVVIGWPYGRFIAKYGHVVDQPLYKWVGHHRYTGSWADKMAVLTQMGDRPATRWVAIVAMVITILLAKRRRWVPPILIAAMFVTQYYTQLGLGAVVHRPHPPTNDGTYPSGSALRLIALGGFCLVLILHYARQRWTALQDRRYGIAVGLIIVLAAYIEAYTRVDLMRHWLTDLIGGWLVSGILLASFIYASRTLIAAPDDVESADEEPATTSAVAG
jgi:membrane-associated phospholipid phosphatase